MHDFDDYDDYDDYDDNSTFAHPIRHFTFFKCIRCGHIELKSSLKLVVLCSLCGCMCEREEDD